MGMTLCRSLCNVLNGSRKRSLATKSMPGEHAVAKKYDQRADRAAQGQGEQADQPASDLRHPDTPQEQDGSGAAGRGTTDGA